jgi:hypothetical protein
MPAAPNPPKPVPVIDYITLTISKATRLILDQGNIFPGGAMSEAAIDTDFRRLYRVFICSFSAHKDIFERIEKQT